MNTYIEKTLTLYGEDSVRLAQMLFMPTKEQRQQNIDLFNKLNEEINIIKTSKGYVAEIKDFEL